MKHAVECTACGTSLKIPEAIWERRVRGRLTTILCKKCKSPIEIDGREEGYEPPPLESSLPPLSLSAPPAATTAEPGRPLPAS